MIGDYGFNSRDVEIINDMIEKAIFYGGDPGGPYCLDKSELVGSIKCLMKHIGLDREYILVMKNDFPIIAKKINEPE